jgi:hypothetical protein
MRQGFRFCSLAAIVYLVAAIPAFTRERLILSTGSQPEITIRIYDYAGLQPRAIAETRTQITRILNYARVMTRWIECPTSWVATEEDSAACQQRMLPSELAIMIFHKFKLPNGVRRDSHLGYAEVFSKRQPGHYIYLSYDNIRDSAHAGGLCPPVTLAEVAVHEIGHVLFRSSDHSPTGLMRASWDRQDFQNAAIGNLLFTPRQAEILQAEVAARMKQAGAEGNGTAVIRPE